MFDRLDPELVKPLQDFTAMMGAAGLDFNNLAALRVHSEQMLISLKDQMPDIPGVVTEDRRVQGPAGAPDVFVRIYRPQSEKTLPVLLWIHGGGYMIGNVEQDDTLAKMVVVATGCAIVSVDYRLAPENPYPAPLDDCYAALKWIAENARELHFDRTRIAIGGASAGGGLAAGLALLARDRNEVPVKFQLLIYPMIDDSNTAPASAENPDTLMWTRASNLIGWRAYLGREPGAADISQYAAATRAADLSGLPPAYIAVGELDLFALENIDYARRLIQANVATELHIYPGAFHGFDMLGPVAAVSQRFAADRDQAIKRALAL